MLFFFVLPVICLAGVVHFTARLVDKATAITGIRNGAIAGVVATVLCIFLITRSYDPQAHYGVLALGFVFAAFAGVAFVGTSVTQVIRGKRGKPGDA
jgi:hypothetical protein